MNPEPPFTDAPPRRVEERLLSSWWPWLYIAAMVAGVVFFGWWARHPRGVPMIEYRVAIVIPVWSGLCYLLIALGHGRIHVGGHALYWARYLDWLVTAPLVALALALTATHGLRRHPWRATGPLLGASVLMIASGLAAELVPHGLVRYALFVVGALAQVAVYGLVWGPLRAAADRQSTGLARLYRRVAFFFSVLMAAYPVIWILGPSGLHALTSGTERILYIVFSIGIKVVWSIADVGGLRALGSRGELSH